MSSRALAALGLSALAAACAATGPGDAEEWDREVDGPVAFEEASGGGRWHRMLRVLDDATGEPLEGVRVSAYAEADHPMPGAWTPLRAVETDRDGRALLRWDDLRDAAQWLYFEKDGYGPRGEFGFPGEVRLRRGVDVALRVLDMLGRPAGGAGVEYFLGCGHTPDVRSGRTDAEGRFVLRCVDPREGAVWVRAEGLAGYESLGVLEDLAERFVLRCAPAPAVEGVVLDREGRPAAGLAVGTRALHRGPWTRTDAEGRFRLLGHEAWESLQVEAGDLPGGPGAGGSPLLFFRAAPGVPVRLRLPAPGSEGGEAGEEEESSGVTFRIAAPGTEGGEAWVRVSGVREGDGLAWIDGVPCVGGEGILAARLPRGRWRVTTGSAAGRFAPRTVEVLVEGAAEIPLGTGEENPSLRPRLLRPGEKPGTTEPLEPPREGAFAVVTPEEETGAEPVPGAPGVLFVPARGPFLLRYDEEGATARAFLASLPAGGGPALLLLPDGAPAAPGAVPAPFPEDTLRVLLPDGRPAAGASVRTSCAWGWSGGAFTLDGGGSGRCAGLHRRDRVSAAVPGDPALAPLEAVIEGPGPWTLRWPGATLEVRACDGDGRPLAEFTVAVDGRPVAGKDGRLAIRGLPAGPHRLLVAAPMRKARDLRVVVREGAPRTVEARLAAGGWW